MKANELRIGNYVQFPGIKKPSKVFIIDTTETSTMTKAQPIPLTEDILLKCGFDAEPKVAYSSGEKVDYNVYKCGCLTYNSLQNQWWIGHVVTTSIKYLHQLQNLYFALTNQELTITL